MDPRRSDGWYPGSPGPAQGSHSVLGLSWTDKDAKDVQKQLLVAVAAAFIVGWVLRHKLGVPGVR